MALCGTSANFTPMLAGMVLGKRYVNINPKLDWYRAVLEAYWPASR